MIKKRYLVFVLLLLFLFFVFIETGNFGIFATKLTTTSTVAKTTPVRVIATTTFRRALCGDGILNPREQCDTEHKCPEYHTCNSSCQCVTDCDSYCRSVGYGFTDTRRVASSNDCAGKNNTNSVLAQKLNVLSEDCYAICGKGYFLEGLSTNCCCLKTNKVHCFDCPGQNPNCDDAMTQCKAGIPM